MPDASIASIVSPEHGAQQECSSSLSWPSGRVSFSRGSDIGRFYRGGDGGEEQSGARRERRRFAPVPAGRRIIGVGFHANPLLADSGPGTTGGTGF